MFFEEVERGVTERRKESRWLVWASLLLYRQILDEIEANDYNNFTKRACVGKAKKVLALPVAYGRSLLLPYSLRNNPDLEETTKQDEDGQDRLDRNKLGGVATSAFELFIRLVG
ncbi:hypothetical protein VPH35_126734 [Triticum aestivum]